MRQRVLDVAIAVFSLGLGLVLSHHSSETIGWVLVGLGILAFVILGIIEYCRKIWPPRDKWFADAPYQDEIRDENKPQRAIDKDKRLYWRSPKPQAEGDEFEIDMAKARFLASIKFPPDYSWVEHPKEWQMRFYGENHEIWGDKIGSYAIQVDMKDTNIIKKVRYVQVRILKCHDDMEPETNYAERYGVKVFWRVSHIEAKEFIFNIKGRRFWRVSI
jgi:hypothetical protein